jgi:hypothetical protein
LKDATHPSGFVKHHHLNCHYHFGGVVYLSTIWKYRCGENLWPVMLTWFLYIAIVGAIQLVQNLEVLKALNPVYAFNLLVKYPGGFWILGRCSSVQLEPKRCILTLVTWKRKHPDELDICKSSIAH